MLCLSYHLRVALLIFCLSLSGCDSFCLLGVCFVDEMEVSNRVYDPAHGTFLIEGDVDGEFNSHTFRLGPEQTFNNLSFGISDANTFRQYTAVKKVHFLNEKALATYREKYLLPGKDCPASFMNQNLQSLLLLPATAMVADSLEQYDIPFDARGTEFQLTGHSLQHDSSYFLKSGTTWTLKIPQHENVSSNVGSAKHKLHYFLVTSVD